MIFITFFICKLEKAFASYIWSSNIIKIAPRMLFCVRVFSLIRTFLVISLSRRFVSSYYWFDCQVLPHPRLSYYFNFSSSSFTREKSVAGAARASFAGRDYLRGKIRDYPDGRTGRSRERSGMAPHFRLRYDAVWRKKEMAVKFFRGICRRESTNAR